MMSICIHGLYRNWVGPCIEMPRHDLTLPSTMPYMYGDKGGKGTLWHQLPLWQSHSIVSRGTVIWKAVKYNETDPRQLSEWSFVVRDQWRDRVREHEAVILLKARDGGLKAVPEYVWQPDIDDIGILKARLGRCPVWTVW